MKIMVSGIGGVGGYIAGALINRYGDAVTLIARGSRKASIEEKGLVIHSDKLGEKILRANVTDKPSDAGIQDIIFVCVKNYSLEDALNALKPCVSEETVIVPVLNGVDHGETAKKILGKGQVVDSLIYIVAGYNQDYSIFQNGQYTCVNIAALPEKASMAVDTLLNGAEGIECVRCEDIDKALWDKYVFNCAYNILTAYYNCNTGELREEPIRVAEFEKLMQEAWTVGKAKEVALEEELIGREMYRFLRGLKGDATSSLKHDMEARNKTELETFSGYLVREADNLGLEIPLTRHYYEKLKKRQEEYGTGEN